MDQEQPVKARTQEPLEPTRVIGERVAALRRYRGMTQQDLATALQAVGIDIERIVIAKLESGRRSFVKVDELLALCVVLEISVVDLLVPKDVDAERPYRIVPNATADAVNAREFVRGEDLLFLSTYPKPVPTPGRVQFASPRTRVDPTLWMSPERAERVARRYEGPEEDL